MNQIHAHQSVEKSVDRLFFTSDLHFGHEWLRKFNNRPFQSVELMDEELIKRWNHKVTDDSWVYVLGDIAYAPSWRLKEIFHRLKGRKILIRGNHDGEYFSDELLSSIFSEIHDILYLNISDPAAEVEQDVVLFHYPMIDWENSYKGSWQLFGHVHTRQIEAFENFRTHIFPTQYDVGTDNNGYAPVSFREIMDKIEQQKTMAGFKASNY